MIIYGGLILLSINDKSGICWQVLKFFGFARLFHLTF